MPVRERALRRRNPELACAEVDPSSFAIAEVKEEIRLGAGGQMSRFGPAASGKDAHHEWRLIPRGSGAGRVAVAIKVLRRSRNARRVSRGQFRVGRCTDDGEV